MFEFGRGSLVYKRQSSSLPILPHIVPISRSLTKPLRGGPNPITARSVVLARFLARTRVTQEPTVICEMFGVRRRLN
jgi:hypothetical protein